MCLVMYASCDDVRVCRVVQMLRRHLLKTTLSQRRLSTHTAPRQQLLLFRLMSVLTAVPSSVY